MLYLLYSTNKRKHFSGSIVWVAKCLKEDVVVAIAIVSLLKSFIKV